MKPEDCANKVPRWSRKRLNEAELMLSRNRFWEDNSLEEAVENLAYALKVVDLHTLIVARLHNRACDEARRAAAVAAEAASWETRCAGLPAPVWAVPAPRLAGRRAAVTRVMDGLVYLDVEAVGIVAYSLRRGWAQTAWSAADGQLDVEATIKAWRAFCAERKET